MLDRRSLTGITGGAHRFEQLGISFACAGIAVPIEKFGVRCPGRNAIGVGLRGTRKCGPARFLSRPLLRISRSAGNKNDEYGTQGRLHEALRYAAHSITFSRSLVILNQTKHAMQSA